MNNLVYLSFGRGLHADELVYAALSARRMLATGQGDYRIIVYTDDPGILSDLPVHREPISPEQFSHWAGPYGFKYRVKICVIKDALQKFGGRLVYCDADTYFLKHPGKIFSLIRPGHTVMHIREGYLDEVSWTDDLIDFLNHHDLRDLSGQRWNITSDTAMYNAGVVGLHSADISLLDEVAHLTDQIYRKVRIHTIEQFAFSACFATHTKLTQCYRVVNHYWPTTGRALFREELQRVLHDSSEAGLDERFERLHPHRPRQNLRHNRHVLVTRKRGLYLTLRRFAKRLGLLPLLRRAATEVARVLNTRRGE